MEDSTNFAAVNPDCVNEKTIDFCRYELREKFWKALLRKLYIIYLKNKFGIPIMGEGFRWGKKWLINKGVLKVGRFVYIGPFVTITYPTVIGDLSMISMGVQFVGNDHGYHEVGMPIRVAKPKLLSENSITIVESDAWIGQNATIISGVKIGRGAVVGAGSVVTKDVSPYTVVGGVPAKFISRRFDNPENEKKHDTYMYG